MRLITWIEVATFWEGNCYASRTLLFAMNAIKRVIVNWVEWFKVWLHKKMIVIQKKVGKVGNNLFGLAFTFVTKYFDALEYTKEDEEKLIIFLRCPKKTRKTLWVPSIPSIGIKFGGNVIASGNSTCGRKTCAATNILVNKCSGGKKNSSQWNQERSRGPRDGYISIKLARSIIHWNTVGHC